MIYLCGPINACTDAECTDWREYAKEHLNDETLDPMRRDYRGQEECAFTEIVENDKEDVRVCDAVLVYYPKPSVGTAMEVLYAWDRKKRVVVVDVSGAPLSPWLLYHSTRIFTSLDDAIGFLNT